MTNTAGSWLSRYITEARPELRKPANKSKSRSRRQSEIGIPQSAMGSRQSNALWLTIDGRRLSKQMIAQRITECARRANLKATPHTFRHCRGSHLLRGGASIRHVQQLLGHRGLETTGIYTPVEVEDLKRVVEQAQEQAEALLIE